MRTLESSPCLELQKRCADEGFRRRKPVMGLRIGFFTCLHVLVAVSFVLGLLSSQASSGPPPPPDLCANATTVSLCPSCSLQHCGNDVYAALTGVDVALSGSRQIHVVFMLGSARRARHLRSSHMPRVLVFSPPTAFPCPSLWPSDACLWWMSGLQYELGIATGRYIHSDRGVHEMLSPSV